LNQYGAFSNLDWMQTMKLPNAFRALFICGAAISAMENAKAADLVAVTKNVRGDIVQIVTPVPGKNAMMLGSGFWLNTDGLVVTCLHVVGANLTGVILVRSAVDASLDLSKGNVIDANWQATPAKVVAVDEKNDLAILKVASNPFKSPPIAIVQFGPVRLTAHFSAVTLQTSLPDPGQRILLSGFPLGQPYMIVQEGTVASIAYGLPGWGPTVKILASTLANHGNSGAPIFDDQGKVTGVLEGEDEGPDQARTGISIVIPAFYVSQLAATVH
jgi:S1-C subfamily serine protease